MRVGALVLAGGGARRLGGVDKAMLEVGGRTLLDRVLDAALAVAADVVVVGPCRPTRADGVRFVVEDEAGGGPVPAVAAGLAALRDEPEAVIVLAVDLPFVQPDHLRRLVAEVDSCAPAAAPPDASGRPNPLLTAYRAEALRAALAGSGVHGVHGVRGAGAPAAILLPAATVLVDLGPAATCNVNTPADLEAARRSRQGSVG